MPRYVAFLRGVSPTNAKMPELQRAFEAAGFTGVKTVLSSGNVVFDARAKPDAALARAAEAAMAKSLDRTFPAIVRSVEFLEALLEADPFAAFRLPADAKRVVTFLAAAPSARVALPPERDGVRILALRGTEALTVYTPTPKGPVFMTMLEKTFGKEITTRTWDTVRKCAGA